MRRFIPGRRRAVIVALALGAVLLPASIGLAGSQRFTDVPTSHPFYGDIEALARSGVTGGCSATRYCPTSVVTREQMAAFLNRLGALGSGQAPKVNADRVDGRHAQDLTRVADYWTADGMIIPLDTAAQYGPTLSITAPTSGFVTATVSISIGNDGCLADCAALAYLYHDQTGEITIPTMVSALDGDYDSGSTSGVFPVTAGVNTFRFGVVRNDLEAGGTVTAWQAGGYLTFSPFGSTGGSTLGIAERSPLFERATAPAR